MKTLVKNRELVRVMFDHGLTLLSEDDTEVRISGDLLRGKGLLDGTALPINQRLAYSDLVLSALLRPFDARILEEQVLRIDFGDNGWLQVPPADDYEAWEVALSHGSRLVCTPGGELVEWH